MGGRLRSVVRDITHQLPEDRETSRHLTACCILCYICRCLPTLAFPSHTLGLLFWTILLPINQIVSQTTFKSVVYNTSILRRRLKIKSTGKSLSEAAFIFASTNPQNDDLIVHWIKSSVHENYNLRTCCAHKLVFVWLTFRTIYKNKRFWKRFTCTECITKWLENGQNTCSQCRTECRKYELIKLFCSQNESNLQESNFQIELRQHNLQMLKDVNEANQRCEKLQEENVDLR